MEREQVAIKYPLIYESLIHICNVEESLAVSMIQDAIESGATNGASDDRDPSAFCCAGQCVDFTDEWNDVICIYNDWLESEETDGYSPEQGEFIYTGHDYDSDSEDEWEEEQRRLGNGAAFNFDKDEIDETATVSAKDPTDPIEWEQDDAEWQDSFYRK